MLAVIATLVPELMLAVVAAAIFFCRPYLIANDLGARVSWLCALGLVALAFWIILYGEGSRVQAGGLLLEDTLTRTSHVLVLAASAVAFTLSVGSGRRTTLRDPIVAVLLLLSVVGLLLISSAGDLLSLFLGLQLYAVTAYSLIAQRIGSGKAVSTALRTALSGVFGLSLFLFGIALTGVASGATGYAGLADTLTTQPSVLLPAGLAFLIAGLAFQLAAAPLHLWLSPALEAAPWPVVALMIGAAPLALTSALARLLFTAFGEFAVLWQPVLAGFGLLSVLAGALAAFATNRLSGLLAAFTTSGVGFSLMALSAASVAGGAAMLAHIALYCGTLVGIVAFASLLEKDGRAVDSLNDLDGYSNGQMTRAFAVLVILLSAAAIPPTVGFVLRVNILQTMFDSGLVWQSLVGGAATVLAAFAFLRPAWRIYLSADPRDIETRPARLADLVLTGSVALVVLGLFSLGGLEAVFESAAARLEP